MTSNPNLPTTPNYPNASPLEELPSFGEHLRRDAESLSKSHQRPEHHEKRNPGERLQRVLELAGVVETRKDEEKFNNFLGNLDVKEAFYWLNHINGILREENRSNRGRVANMHAGELVAPPGGVQKTVLSHAAEALGKIEENRHRAALSYYLINALHIFGDGNGRTSRAVFTIFDDPHFNLADDAYYHDTKGQMGTRHSQYPFEKRSGIRSTRDAMYVAHGLQMAKDVGDGKIDEEALTSSPLPAVYVECLEDRYKPVDFYLTPEAEKELSDSEKKRISRAFQYEYPSSIAMCRMATKKDGWEKAITHIDPSQGHKRIIFEVERTDFNNEENLAAKKTFDGWTADDYRDFLVEAESAQIEEFDTLIDIFVSPNEYIVSGGSAADYLSHCSYLED